MFRTVISPGLLFGRFMIRQSLAGLALGMLCGCATESMVMKLPPPDGMPQETSSLPLPVPESPTLQQMSVTELQTQLGLNRSAQDLGFDERGFDGCRIGVKGEVGSCSQRYLSVVHFRLVCRDTVGTTSRVPAS